MKIFRFWQSDIGIERLTVVAVMGGFLIDGSETFSVFLLADITHTKHLAEKIEAIEGVTPPALRRGRFTVPDKLIASLRGA